MIEYAWVILFVAVASYIGARFALLAEWKFVAGAARLVGMWAAACWLGYGTPLYVAVALLPLGFVWAALAHRLPALIAFELVLLGAMVWHSGTPPVVIYLIGLVVLDQVLTRLLLMRFDRQVETRPILNRLVVVVGIIGAVAAAGHFFKDTSQRYLESHAIATALGLVPQGAVPLWFHRRELTGPAAGGAVQSSVYWESRFAGDSADCVLSFHGAARAGSLQPAGRAIAKGVRQAGLRYFAIDHPGFGASPTPAADAPVDAWDPALLTSAVIKSMRIANCSAIHVMGHSQGVTEALRLLTNNDPGIAEVLVLGAGLYLPDEERETYWHERFHLDRGLHFNAEGTQALTFEQWKLVRNLYYLNQEYCSDTLIGRDYREIRSLNFVQFAQEHANLVATRDTLWDCLDYPQKTRTLLPVDHYLNAVQLGSLVLVPRTSPALVAELLSLPDGDSELSHDTIGDTGGAGGAASGE